MFIVLLIQSYYEGEGITMVGEQLTGMGEQLAALSE
jgi:hypothetical protein